MLSAASSIAASSTSISTKPRSAEEVRVGTMQDYEAPREYGSGIAAGDRPGIGWVRFAGVMLGLAGLWNFIEGIAAISNAHVYVANANYVFSDLNTWGWIVLVLGVLQGFAAFAVLTGSEIGRWFGVAV